MGKRIKKANELMWILGIIFVALGVSICSKADLGVSMIAAPAFIISEALIKNFAIFSVGVTEYIIQGLLLVIMCVIIFKFNWRYLLAFAVAIIYGYTLNLFLWLVGGLVVAESSWVRWMMLFLGDFLIAFGVACCFKTYMPLQVYELFVAEVAKRFNMKIEKVKYIFDISLLLISITLSLTLFGDIETFNFKTVIYSSYHSIGLGTFVTTVINSPLINFCGKLIGRLFDNSPRFIKLEKLLKRR